VFVSRHQTVGQNCFVKVANKSFGSGKVQIFGKNGNKSCKIMVEKCQG
jgi:hypothetical protein